MSLRRTHGSSCSLRRPLAESTLWEVVGLTALTVGYCYYWQCQVEAARKKRKEKPWPVVPGGLPFIGHLHLIGSNSNFVDKVEEWADEYGRDMGCYEFSAAGDPCVVVCRQDRALEVVLQRPNDVTRSSSIKESAKSIKSDGVFNAEGDVWVQERKIVAAALNRKNTQEYMSVMTKMISRLIEKWKKDIAEKEKDGANNNKVLVIDNDISNFATDTISLVGMNRDFDFLNHPTSHSAQNIKVTMKALMSRSFAPFWYWNIPLVGQFLDGYGSCINKVERLFQSVVDEQISANSSSSSDGGDGSSTRATSFKNTFLQKMFEGVRSLKSSLTRDRAVANVIGLYLAATDTTSATITLAMYVLAKDTKLQQTLREEVDKLEMDETSSTTTGITIENLFDHLPRVKAFLHEIHRFYAVPINPLEAGKDIPFCGTTVAKGTQLLVLNRYISVNTVSPPTDIPLGPNGETTSQFCPERWLQHNHQSTTTGSAGESTTETTTTCISPATSRTGAGFLLFGHGVRACPGRLYAEVLSVMTLVAFLQEFEWTLAENHPPVKVIFHVTMSNNVPIQLQMKQRTTTTKTTAQKEPVAVAAPTESTTTDPTMITIAPSDEEDPQDGSSEDDGVPKFAMDGSFMLVN